MGRKTVVCQPNVLTLVDPDLITTIRIQNNDCHPVYVVATDTNVAPEDPKDGAIMIRPQDIATAQGVENLFPDVGTDGYIWLIADDKVQVSLSYV